MPDARVVDWPSHWPRQQLRDVMLPAVVGRDADRLLYAARFQRLIDHRLDEGCHLAVDFNIFALQLLCQMV